MIRKVYTFLIAGVLTAMAVPDGPAVAAPGDVDSTPFALPSAVTSLTPRGSFQDGRGGLYFLFADSTTLSVVRSEPSGAIDTAFGASGVATTAISSADQRSYKLATTPVTGATWIAAENRSPQILELVSLTGTGTLGTPLTVDLTPVMDSCYGSGNIGSVQSTPYARRNGGVWLVGRCAVGGSFPEATPYRVTAFDNAGMYESGVGVLNIDDPTGTGATCATYSRAVADPTGSGTSDDLRIIRVLHAVQTSAGDCLSSVFAASDVAANHSGIDLLSIDTTGSIERTALQVGAGAPPMDALGLMVDPGGRVIVLTRDLANPSQGGVIRLASDRTVDTAIGTNGYLPLSLPAAAGTSASETGLEFLGLVTTVDQVLFIIGIPDRFSVSCSGTWNLNLGYQVGMMSLTSGWLSDWGTSGIGDSVVIDRVDAPAGCPPVFFGGFGVDPSGRARVLTFAQDDSITLNLWESVEGVTGGSAGGTGTGGYTSDTGGAPSVGDGLSTIEQPAVTTTTTTTVAEDTTTSVADDPSDVQLPATGSATPVAIAVMFVAVGALATLRRRSI